MKYDFEIHTYIIPGVEKTLTIKVPKREIVTKVTLGGYELKEVQTNNPSTYIEN